MNTIVIVRNDGLSDIANDTRFGKNLANTVEVFASKGGISGPENRTMDFAAGNHGNPAGVVATFHADTGVVLLAGGNIGTVIGHRHGAWRFEHDDVKLQLLSVAAHNLGYRLVPEKQ